MNQAGIDNRFDYHPPGTSRKVTTHEQVRKDCKALAISLDQLLPEGREKALAMTNLEQAMFWSNASVARHVEAAE